MSVINVNSISGINSITAQSTSVTFYNTTGGLGEIIADFDQTVASRSEIVGISTVGITTINNSTITLIGSGQAANISNGFSVVGAGITPGTTVASGGGTVNIVLSQTAGFSTATNALTFYTNSKPVSPGGVGGMLCRAWVNFNGTVPAVGMIRAANNVSSITDGGVGIYTLNFTTAMPNTNYTPITSGDYIPTAGSYTNNRCTVHPVTFNTNSLLIVCGWDITVVDPQYVGVSIFT